MTTPVDEYFQVKQAGFGSSISGVLGEAAQKFPSAMGKGLATGAAGAVGVLGATAAQKIIDAISKKHEFNQMLEQNPDLHEHYQRDSKFFNQAYSSLRAANPGYGKDPLISGFYLRRIMDDHGLAGSILRESMQDSKPQSHPVMEAFSKGMSEGGKKGLEGEGSGGSAGRGRGFQPYDPAGSV